MKRFKASALSYRFPLVEEKLQKDRKALIKEKRKRWEVWNSHTCLLWVRNSVFDSELLRIIHVPDTVLSTGKEEKKRGGSALT